MQGSGECVMLSLWEMPLLWVFIGPVLPVSLLISSFKSFQMSAQYQLVLSLKNEPRIPQLCENPYLLDLILLQLGEIKCHQVYCKHFLLFGFSWDGQRFLCSGYSHVSECCPLPAQAGGLWENWCCRLNTSRLLSSMIKLRPCSGPSLQLTLDNLMEARDSSWGSMEGRLGQADSLKTQRHKISLLSNTLKPALYQAHSAEENFPRSWALNKANFQLTGLLCKCPVSGLSL